MKRNILWQSMTRKKINNKKIKNKKYVTEGSAMEDDHSVAVKQDRFKLEESRQTPTEKCGKRR